MLGFYENFPVNVHMVAQLTTSVSVKRLQQAIIQALHKLNNENLSLDEEETQKPLRELGKPHYK